METPIAENPPMSSSGLDEYIEREVKFALNEIEPDQSASLLLSALKSKGFVSAQTDSFNGFVSHDIASIISDEPLRIVNKTDPRITFVVGFSNPMLERPVNHVTVAGVKTTVAQLPEEALRNVTSYRGRLSAQVDIEVHFAGMQGAQFRAQRIIELGYIPVMVGSNSCNTTFMEPEELAKRGESIGALKGYFIINGVRKGVNIQERNIENKPLIYPPKANAQPVLRFNGSRNSQSVMMTIMTKKEKKRKESYIHFTSPCFGSINNVNVFTLFRMLWIPRDKVEKWIQMLCPDNKTRAAVLTALTSTLVAAYKGDQDQTYPNSSLYTELRSKLSPNVVAKHDIKETSSVNDMRKMVEVIMNEVCFNIRDEDKYRGYMRKLISLLDMTIEYAKYLRGLRSQTSRDEWTNKEIRGAGKSLAVLFARVWMDVKDTIITSLSEMRLANVNYSELANNVLSTIGSVFGKRDCNITDIFTTTFGIRWGTPTSKKVENMTDELKTSNVAMSLSLLTRISVDINSSAAQKQVREIQPTQIGMICIIKSPEGQNIGLVKYLALLCSVSLDYDLKAQYDLLLSGMLTPIVSRQPTSGKFYEIRYYLSNVGYQYQGYNELAAFINQISFSQSDLNILHIQNTPEATTASALRDFSNAIFNFHFPTEFYNTIAPQEGYASKVYFNGELIGHSKGEELKDHLIKLRRGIDEDGNNFAKAVPPTFNLWYNTKNDSVHIQSGSARPVRPLLVVNKRNELLIEKYNAWNLSFVEACQRGYIEFVDPSEQERIVIAMSISRFHKAKQQIEEAKQRLENAEAEKETMLQAYSDVIPRIEELKNQLQLDESRYGSNSNLYKAALEDYEMMLEAEGISSALEELERTAAAVEEAKAFLDISITRGTFTHVELDPVSIYGVAAATILWSGSSAGPRNALESVQGTQALSYGITNFWRSPEDAVALVAPSRPLVETSIYRAIGMDALPTGKSVILAIMTHLGFGQEDALVIKRQAIERGLFWWLSKSVFRERIDTKRRLEIPTIPVYGKDGKEIPIELRADPSAYMKLDPKTCLPRRGMFFEEGDCIIPIVRYDGDRRVDCSIFVDRDKGGKVVDVIAPNVNGTINVKVTLSKFERPELGDKFSSRIAQKATIGYEEDEWNLPRTENGVTPDIICNPHAITSRMTYNKLIEVIASKVALLTGERISADSFRNPKEDVNKFLKILAQYGFSPSGKTRLYSGTTGELLEADVFIGPCYYRLLSHLVKKKWQARATGAREHDTRQPVGGKRRKGGSAVRVGEMERDALLSHGAAENTNNRLKDVSDAFETVICTECGQFAMMKTDGTYCMSCKKQNTGARVVIPYAFATLDDTLKTMTIKSRFKTRPIGERGVVRSDRADFDEEYTGEELEEDEEEIPEEEDAIDHGEADEQYISAIDEEMNQDLEFDDNDI